MCTTATMSGVSCMSIGNMSAAARRWLVVERDTFTHQVHSVVDAAEFAQARTAKSSQWKGNSQSGEACKREGEGMTFSRFDDGGLIDRSQRIGFSFDGKQLEGFVGDTLASALLANGISLMGRSFKYHRPRGLTSGGASEPNALVTIGDGSTREPNLRASMVALREGLVAESQNRWPSLGFDARARSIRHYRRFWGQGFTTRPSCGKHRFGKSFTSR